MCVNAKTTAIDPLIDKVLRKVASRRSGSGASSYRRIVRARLLTEEDKDSKLDRAPILALIALEVYCSGDKSVQMFLSLLL